MQIADSQLKSFILDQALISETELVKAEADAKQKKASLHEAILALGLVPEAELLKLEAYILGVPFIDLTKETIDPQVLHLIPEPIARKANVIAFRKSGKELEVAMLDPEDIQTI